MIAVSRALLSVSAGGWLLAAATLPASAAIVYVQVPVERQSCLSAGAPLVCPFDLDGDGSVEFEVVSGESFTNFIRIFPAGAIVGNPDRNVYPYGFGEEIKYGVLGLDVTQGHNSLLLSFGFDGATGGAFYGRDAYMGFSLVRGAEGLDFHFGWFHIQEIAGFGPLMLEYAYQTEPNVPIFAGQIPEPSTAGLLGTGTAFLLQRHRPQTKQNKALQRTPRGWVVFMLSVIRKCCGFGGAHSRP